MCGIAGAVWIDPAQALPPEALARMTAALAHRGPDDAGTYHAEYRTRPPYEPQPGVALGHRRLAIIDVAGNKQPIANEDQSIWLVFNGEVYNYRDLRRRLEGSGHRFRSDGDSECIVHLYEDLGPECFSHCDGMLSAAIWDANHRRLVLARDRLGKKPLVYRLEHNRLLFASELKALLELPDVPRAIDAGALDEYLAYQYVPPPNTIFRGIHKLPPAHYAVYQDGRLSVKRYWEPAWNTESSVAVPAACERLTQLFDDAVKSRLQSEVPLGAFLSGGIDSSLVAASMQRQAGMKIKTFSIGFPEAEYDETPYARQVARHLGTEHTELQVTPDAAATLPQLVTTFDEPFGDSSALPTFYLAQLARQHVTVALTGDGGDELFAGYPRYKAARLAAMLDQAGPVRSLLAARVWQAIPSSGRQKSRLRQFKRFSESLSLSPARRYFDWISIFSEARRAELYREEFVDELPNSDPFQYLQQAWKKVLPRDAVSCASLADLQTYLPSDLLVKVDLASMAHGLECRQPFLDHRLVEFAVGLPARMKLRGRRSKWLLHQAFDDRLPPDIWRRKKMGFGVPLDHWFRKELKDLAADALLGPSAKTAVYFRPEIVRRLFDEHQQSRFDHSARLWSLLFLELWLRRRCGP